MMDKKNKIFWLVLIALGAGGEFKKEMRNDINLQNNVFNHVEFLLKQ
jgi:hypothetical protein